MKLQRRDFFRLSSLLPALMTIKSGKLWAKKNQEEVIHTRLSQRANKTIDLEGSWELSDIEGKLPDALTGSFYKIGPGTKEIFGQKLKHYFDGDGYVAKISITDGKAELVSRFIQTPQRMKEQSSGQMLFDEFGTAAPKATREGRKNQPNISIFPWGSDILALSEGGHPAVIDPLTLEFKELTNFKGSLPKNVSFSAHPKIDPKTGDAFAFGIQQGISRALKVYRMNAIDGKCEELYSLNQNHVFMIHDMAMTEDHLVFLIPPVYFKITDIIFAKGSLADALEFDPKLGSKLLVLDKKGIKKPIEMKLPSCLTFHHANAVLNGDVLTLHTFTSSDTTILDVISDWNGPVRAGMTYPDLREMKIDLKNKKLLQDKVLCTEHDFPVFNEKRTGSPYQYLYMTGMGPEHDPFALNRITKMDLLNNKVQSLGMPDQRVCGEAFFIERKNAQTEDDGWLAFMGYDGNRDESFLEIRDARTLGFEARVWTGIYLPLGFHGKFIS